jgi:c-di-AMP phosphodiesterase-like protein
MKKKNKNKPAALQVLLDDAKTFLIFLCGCIIFSIVVFAISYVYNNYLEQAISLMFLVSFILILWLFVLSYIESFRERLKYRKMGFKDLNEYYDYVMSLPFEENEEEYKEVIEKLSAEQPIISYNNGKIGANANEK